jgi:hypothetical protein
MALAQNINDREYAKFVEEGGQTAVRVKQSGVISTSFSGLNIGGKVSVVSINNTTWSALPPTALADRNALAILNRSGQEIVINYDNTTVGYVGVPISDGAERQYDITEVITIYAKSQTSACTIIVEEIA